MKTINNMKTINKIFLIFAFSFALSCTKEENLTNSVDSIFPEQDNSEIDDSLRKMYSPYNSIVQYKYIKNYYPNDWYSIIPIKEELVLEVANFLMDNFIKQLEKGSSLEFVKKTSPRRIIFVGSPAYKLDGTVVLGQAEGGTIITFTETNNFKNSAIRTRMLHTAYHEYGHIVHQLFSLPDIYRTITPENYTLSGWQALSGLDAAIKRGMVSRYATKSINEDFVELFASYITFSQKDLDYLLIDEVIDPSSQSSAEVVNRIEKNEGREFIRIKLGILKKYLTKINFDIDTVRDEVQKKLNPPII